MLAVPAPVVVLPSGANAGVVVVAAAVDVAGFAAVFESPAPPNVPNVRLVLGVVVLVAAAGVVAAAVLVAGLEASDTPFEASAEDADVVVPPGVVWPNENVDVVPVVPVVDPNAGSVGVVVAADVVLGAVLAAEATAAADVGPAVPVVLVEPVALGVLLVAGLPAVGAPNVSDRLDAAGAVPDVAAGVDAGAVPNVAPIAGAVTVVPLAVAVVAGAAALAVPD